MRYFASIIFFLFGIFFTSFSFAQSRPLPVQHFKYKVVKEIMDRLAFSFSDPRPTPYLIMNGGSTSNRVAEFSTVAGAEIVFDERLYDLCRDMGRDSLDAMAFILSHELSHYYLKHDEWAGFAQMASGEKVSSEKTGQAQALELVADKNGLFHSFAAGYNTFDLVARLYEKIYKEYRIPDNLQGYLSKDERIKLTKREENTVQKDMYLFEIGKFFYQIGQYTEAEQCFAYITNDFPLKELFVNMGVCNLRLAFEHFSISEMPFALPFQMETVNRLKSISRSPAENAERYNYLKVAENHFQNAIKQDRTYLTAYTDLAITQLLQSKPGTAGETLDDAKKETEWSDDAQLVKAITMLYNGNFQNAEKLLKQTGNVFQKEYNESIFREFGQAIAHKKPLDPSELKVLYEKYFKSNPAVTSNTPLPGTTTPLIMPWQTKDFILIPVSRLRAYIRNDKTSVSYRIMAGNNLRFELISFYASGTHPLLDSIPYNSNSEILAKNYGIPDDTIPYGTEKQYLVYKNQGLIFQVENEKIIHRFIFRQYAE